MPIETVVVTSIVVSVVALILAVVAVWRGRASAAAPDPSPVLSALKEATGHLDGTLRDEAGRGRAEAGEGARALREEVGTAMRGFQDSVLKGMAEMQNLQKGQLETFADKLADGVAAIDRRVGGMATDLKTNSEAATEGAERRHQALQAMVDGKLGVSRSDAATSAKALREEVTTTLKQHGDTLTNSIAAIATTQKERLERVATELAALTQKQEAAQEGLKRRSSSASTSCATTTRPNSNRCVRPLTRSCKAPWRSGSASRSRL